MTNFTMINLTHEVETKLIDALSDSLNNPSASDIHYIGHGASRITFEASVSTIENIIGSHIPCCGRKLVIKVVIGVPGVNQMENETRLYETYERCFAPIYAIGKYIEIMEYVYAANISLLSKMFEPSYFKHHAFFFSTLEDAIKDPKEVVINALKFELNDKLKEHSLCRWPFDGGERSYKDHAYYYLHSICLQYRDVIDMLEDYCGHTSDNEQLGFYFRMNNETNYYEPVLCAYDYGYETINRELNYCSNISDLFGDRDPKYSASDEIGHIKEYLCGLANVIKSEKDVFEDFLRTLGESYGYDEDSKWDEESDEDSEGSGNECW